MLIKGGREDKAYVVCAKCGRATRMDKTGGHCGCGNISVNHDRKDGTAMIIADDSDAVIYDNDK